MRDRLTAVLAASGIAALLTGFVVIGTAGAAQAGAAPVAPNAHQVAICHATATPGKYTVTYPTKKQVSDNGGHSSGGGVHPGDIIPGFLAGGTGGSAWADFAGQNYSGASLEIYNNGCGESDTAEQVTPAYPYATEPRCGVAGSLVVPAQPDGVRVVTAEGTDGAGPGAYDFAYEAEDDYILVGDDEITVTVRPAIPSQSTDAEGDCYVDDGDGDEPVVPEIDSTDPCGTEDDTVDGVAKDGYTFKVDERTGIVRFTPVEGYYLDGPATLRAKWTNKPCATEVTPVAPTVEQSPRCEVEGSFTIADTPGVRYLLDGEPIGPDTYEGPVDATLTAEAVGHAVLTDADWTYDLVVDEAEDCGEVLPGELTDLCPNLDGVQAMVPAGHTVVDGRCVKDTVKGDGHERPRPVVGPDEAVGPGDAVGPRDEVGPEVLPTAVDAGIGAPMSAGSPAVDPLGLALVAGGAGLLLLAGARKIGRRERGAHQV